MTLNPNKMAGKAMDDPISDANEPTQEQIALIAALAKTALEAEPCVFTAAELMCAATAMILRQNFAPTVALDLYAKVSEGAYRVLKDHETDAGELTVECGWLGEEKRPVWLVILAGADGKPEDSDAVMVWDTLDQAITDAMALSAKLKLPWRTACVDHSQANVVPIQHGRRH